MLQSRRNHRDNTSRPLRRALFHQPARREYTSFTRGVRGSARKYTSVKYMSLLVMSRRRLQGGPLPEKVDGKAWKSPRNQPQLTRMDLGNMYHTRTGLVVPVSASKAQVVALISMHDSFVALQHAVRRFLIARSKRPRFFPLAPDNTECNFTLEPLQHPIFVRVTSSGYKRGFSLEPLIDYINTCGKVEDPVDRETFTDSDLARMDRLALAVGLQKTPVSQVKTPAAQARYREERDREEQVELLLDDLDTAVHNSFYDAVHTEVPVAFILQTDFRSFYQVRVFVRMILQLTGDLQRTLASLESKRQGYHGMLRDHPDGTCISVFMAAFFADVEEELRVAHGQLLQRRAEEGARARQRSAYAGREAVMDLPMGVFMDDEPADRLPLSVDALDDDDGEGEDEDEDDSEFVPEANSDTNGSASSMEDEDTDDCSLESAEWDNSATEEGKEEALGDDLSEQSILAVSLLLPLLQSARSVMLLVLRGDAPDRVAADEFAMRAWVDAQNAFQANPFSHVVQGSAATLHLPVAPWDDAPHENSSSISNP